MATAVKRPKKRKIRNNEYYDTQAIFDDLYAKSQKEHIFKDLMQYTTSSENILLAYRNIKKNKGSKTKGGAIKARFSPLRRKIRRCSYPMCEIV